VDTYLCRSIRIGRSIYSSRRTERRWRKSQKVIKLLDLVRRLKQHVQQVIGMVITRFLQATDDTSKPVLGGSKRRARRTRLHRGLLSLAGIDNDLESGVNCAGWYLGRVSSRGVNSGTLVKSSDGMEVGPMCAGMCELGMVDSDPSRDSYMGFCSGSRYAGICENVVEVRDSDDGRDPSRDSYMGFCSGAFCEYTGTVVEFGVGRVPLGQ
jgi:hypothetical protein